MIIVELKNEAGKTVIERINEKRLEMAEKIAEKRNPKCTIFNSYEDRKQSRRSSMKDRW